MPIQAVSHRPPYHSLAATIQTTTYPPNNAWWYGSKQNEFLSLNPDLLLIFVHRLPFLFYLLCFFGCLFFFFFKDLSLFPCLTCFTVSKEHPLFTYSRAPGLFSSNNLSQVIVLKSWDSWQENKGHTSPWKIYMNHTCSIILALNMHPRTGAWLPLTGCSVIIIGHPSQDTCL